MSDLKNYLNQNEAKDNNNLLKLNKDLMRDDDDEEKRLLGNLQKEPEKN